MRLRLTVAVGVVTALFLGLATFLFSERANTAVLDGVRADQGTIVSTEIGAAVGSASVAAEIYAQLEAQGLLADFWSLLGMSVPDASSRIVFEQDQPPLDAATPPKAATEASPGAGRIVVRPGTGGAEREVVVPASTVIGLGEPLLNGVAPSDLIIIGGTTEALAVPAGGGADAGVGGTYTVEQPVTAIPVENVRSSVAGLGRDLWIASGLLTLLAMGATWLLTGRALRPVEAITRRVDEIATAGSGERVPVPPTHDEIGHLARTVNTMLDRLDAAAVTQRRFVADASHELRSPLAVIRTEAEVALAHPAHTDWPTTTRNVLDETHRLEGLVSDLLVLAQRDDGRPLDRSAAADVDDVVHTEAARLRRVPVDTSGVLAGRVQAQPTDVARVVRHLLDNAARHATTMVRVSVRPEGDHVVLTVDDDGAGVPEAERARIFERFARLEESRSRDEGGAGLGLAVVASVVAALDGSVSVGEAPLGGARFTVRLPAAD